MATYIHFTEEQKQRANSIDLKEFSRRQAEILLTSGRENLFRGKAYTKRH